LSRRVIERDRFRAGLLRAAALPRVVVRRFGVGAKLNWQRGRRRGPIAHRASRLAGVGNIGGQRQRRLRAARAH
jgi:hypothetical protein